MKKRIISIILTAIMIVTLLPVSVLANEVQLSVKNVKAQQRWPWNGYVDISFDLTGTKDSLIQVTEVSVIENNEVMATVSPNQIVLLDESSKEGEKLSLNLQSCSGQLGENYYSTAAKIKLTASVEDKTVFAESDPIVLDLRQNINLTDVEIADVVYDDTLWGDAYKANVSIGYINDGDSQDKGVLVSDLSGSGKTDVSLPKKNGTYRLTHSTGDLQSFATFTVTSCKPIETWADLQTAITNANTSETVLHLTKSLTAGSTDSALTIGEYQKITLDLNGCTLDRGLATATGDGNVITVNGELTLIDTSQEKSGKITGGNDSGSKGGGVYVAPYANFNMIGGSITGNNTEYAGGGVFVPMYANFKMTGGTITGNTAANNGGGVYTPGNTTLGGTAKITGNKNGTGAGATDNNLYLIDGVTITLGTGSAVAVPVTSSGMSVGVTMESPGKFAVNAKEEYTECFFADSNSYAVKFNNNTTEQDATDDYLELVSHTHNFSYSVGTDSDANVITATCSANGCTLAGSKVTLMLTANNATYNGTAYDGASTDDETVKFGETTGATVGNIEYWSTGDDAKKLDSAPINVGNYEAKVTVTYNTDQTVTATKAFTIAPKEISISWDNTAFTYNGQNQAPTPTLTGIVDGDECEIVGNRDIISHKGDTKSLTTYSAVGLYDRTVLELTNSNYTLGEKRVTFKINPAPLTITSATAITSKTYDGTTNAAATAVTLAGFVNGETLKAGVDYIAYAAYDNADAGDNKTITVTVTLQDSDKAGNYKMTGSGLSLTGSITKAAVTITANDKNAYVGDALPTLDENDFTVEGLVNGENLSSKPALSYEATPDMKTATTVAIKASGADAGNNYSISYVDGTLTISNKPSSGGSSASSSFTVPVTGDGNTVKVSATVSGNNVTVNQIKDSDLKKVAEGESVTIDLSGAGKNVDTAKIPTKTVEKIAETSSLTVKLPVATVEFDEEATQEIADQAEGSTIELVVDDIKEVSLNAVQKEAVKKLDTAIIIDAYLVSNGTKLCTKPDGGFGGGKAKVILPYEIKNNRTSANYSVFYVTEEGKLEKLNAVYDEEFKAFVFEIEHFSVYAVAYDDTAMPFVDIAYTDFFYDAVKWAANNGITDGVDATHFTPNGITSRAQMVTFIWRAAGCPEPKTTDNPFTDVKEGSYYYKAVLWAYENGITDGTTETSFSPDDNVSRAQAVTFLWRYKGEPVVNYWMNMSDIESGKYYTEAVRWALSEKITNGTSTTTFSPNNDCLRYQIVCFLYRYFVK